MYRIPLRHIDRSPIWYSEVPNHININSAKSSYDIQHKYVDSYNVILGFVKSCSLPSPKLAIVSYVGNDTSPRTRARRRSPFHTKVKCYTKCVPRDLDRVPGTSEFFRSGRHLLIGWTGSRHTSNHYTMILRLKPDMLYRSPIKIVWYDTQNK